MMPLARHLCNPENNTVQALTCPWWEGKEAALKLLSAGSHQAASQLATKFAVRLQFCFCQLWILPVANTVYVVENQTYELRGTEKKNFMVRNGPVRSHVVMNIFQDMD